MPVKRGRKPKSKPKPKPVAHEIKRGRKNKLVAAAEVSGQTNFTCFAVNQEINVETKKDEFLILQLPIKQADQEKKEELPQPIKQVLPVDSIENDNYTELHCKHTGENSIAKCPKCVDKFNQKNKVETVESRVSIRSEQEKESSHEHKDIEFREKLQDTPIQFKVRVPAYSPFITNQEQTRILPNSTVFSWNEEVDRDSELNITIEKEIDRINNFQSYYPLAESGSSEGQVLTVAEVLNLDAKSHPLSHSQLLNAFSLLQHYCKNELIKLEDEFVDENSNYYKPKNSVCEGSVQHTQYKITQNLQFFTGNRLPATTHVWCWWDSHPFNGPVVGYPVHYNRRKHLFTVRGCFCSFNCACAYMEAWSKIDHSLMYYFYRVVTEDKHHKDIKPSLPRETLQIFGGEYNIATFRKKSVDPTLKVCILPAKVVNWLSERIEETSTTFYKDKTEKEETDQGDKVFPLRLARNKPLKGHKNTFETFSHQN